jgi:hypothetical protein
MVHVLPVSGYGRAVAGRKLTDQDALDRLERASAVLGDEPAETVQAQTALTVARSAMTMLMLGLEGAVDGDCDPADTMAAPEA